MQTGHPAFETGSTNVSKSAASNSYHPESKFFQALNAPFLPSAAPTFRTTPKYPPTIPSTRHSHAYDTPLFNASGDWQWLNGLPIHYDQEDAISCKRNYSTSIRTGQAGGTTFSYLNKSWILDQSKSSTGIITELFLYKSSLSQLMGKTIPRLVAVRSSPHRLNLVMELPHHSFCVEASSDMPEVLKRRVVLALKKIHHQGIYHGSIELSNFLIAGDGTVYVLNFHRSLSITPNPAVWLESAEPSDFRMEMRELEYKLDYQDARTKEKEKIGRFVSRFKNHEPALREDDIDPPLNLYQDHGWFSDQDRDPKRFVMPGQYPEDFDWELKRFLNILQKMEIEDISHGHLRLKAAKSLPFNLPEPTGTITVKREELETKIGQNVTPTEIQPGSDHYKLRKRKQICDIGSGSIDPSRKLSRVLPQERPREIFRKHDAEKSVAELVPHTTLNPSIQMNNITPGFPFIAVRDFASPDTPVQCRGEKRKNIEDQDSGHAVEQPHQKRLKLDPGNTLYFWRFWRPFQPTLHTNVRRSGKDNGRSDSSLRVGSHHNFVSTIGIPSTSTSGAHTGDTHNIWVRENVLVLEEMSLPFRLIARVMNGLIGLMN